MKRTVLALALILALSFLLSAVVEANPNLIHPLISMYPTEPITNPTEIIVYSPVQNQTYNSTDVWLNFTMTQPSSLIFNVSSIYYTVDFSHPQNISVPSISHITTVWNFSTPLTLEEGTHCVIVYLEAESHYRNKDSHVGETTEYPYFHIYSVKVTGFSANVYFRVDITAPNISVLSLQNKIYNASDVPLNFTVNESVSQITYSIDGKESVTINGNTTLTGLPYGDHNLTVYATDEAGNMGASETIPFNVADPSEPFPTAQVATVASGASVAVVGVGLLVYLKKRKR